MPIVNVKLKRLLRLLHTARPSPMAPTAGVDPPPFDPLKPATPVSYPIMTMDDLLSRSYFDSFHYPFNKASTPLDLPAAGSSAALRPRPRLLVCHDMQGGYVDDKWVQGGANSDAYAIWHWYLIDVFVYFSHNLVNLPPPCWTNAGHAHGVKVLGTFITEGDKGRAACDVLLSSKESAHLYAERLSELAFALGFDGWLLNMEVNLDQAQIPNLKEFVSHLTATMHSSVPGSLVIWYDSVTKDGVLDWQNQLNEYNKPFFDLCDGIFVNYTWTEDYPKKSASIAGERKFDVYMGIDVFGRGTFGGGQWTTNVALDVIKKDYVSAALFAPGWVYETKQPPDFQSAQNRWWGLVEKSWSLAQKYPKRLPFYSNFDQGHGLHVFIEGKKVSSSSWNNISAQTLQPILDGSSDPSPTTVEASIDLKDASYSGGSSIKFSGTIEADSSVLIRLFEADIPMGDLPIYITYSVYAEADSMLGISIGFTKTLEKVSILLLLKDRVFPPPRQLTSKFDKVITACEISKFIQDKVDGKGWTLQQASIKMKDYTLTDVNVVCYKAGKFHTGENFESCKNNTLHNATTGYHASLGHISIRHSDMNAAFPPASSWLVTGEDIQWESGSQGTKTVSLKISWKLKEGSGDSSMFSKYNVYFSATSKQFASTDEDNLVGIDGTYLGVAKVESFYVYDLIIPHDVSKLLFVIQVCSIDGACQKLDESPTYQLQANNQSYLEVDVELLSDGKAINNSFGADNDVAKFFNHLRKDAFDVEHHYVAEPFEDVIRNYRRRLNGRWFEFKWLSFSSPWLFMLAMAALILVLFTFTQAAVSVFSRIDLYC